MRAGAFLQLRSGFDEIGEGFFIELEHGIARPGFQNIDHRFTGMAGRVGTIVL